MHRLRTLRLGYWTLAFGATGATAGNVSEALAATEASRAEPHGLHWAPCGDEYPNAECAVAQVPLDYADPHGEQIGIQLARIRGANATASVFINPGGPGGSGVDLLLSGFGEYMSTTLEGRFDIVGFDPRGIGSSAPLRCLAGAEEDGSGSGRGDAEGSAGQDEEAPLPTFPYLPEQERPYYDVLSSLSELCGDDERIRQHMSTAEVARDLDRLREAVGDELIHYLGFSYGSFLGNTYANLFPDKVGALVIDGVVDPTLWSTGLHVMATRVSLQDELDELLRLCDEPGAGCALSGEGGAGARYDVVDNALSIEPLQLGDRTFSYDQFVAYIVGSLYTPDFEWPGSDGFGAFLGALYSSVLGEDGAADSAAAILQAIDARWAPVPTFSGYDNSDEGYFGNYCSDAELPTPFDDYSNIGSFAGRDSVFGAYWWWSDAGCAHWPLSEERYVGPWTAETAAPVLIIGNYFDGVTDYAGAVSSAALLPNSRLLSYGGRGHTAFGYNDCITQHVVRYFIDGVLPPEDTLCDANPNPFIPPPPEVASTGEGAAAPAAASRAWPGVRRPHLPAVLLRH